jgi:uncharacterized protein YegP (UPF0339 family)
MAEMSETAFEVYQGSDGEWRWRLKAGNHEIVASSEGYTDKAGAIRAVGSMKRWVENAAVEEIIEEGGE